MKMTRTDHSEQESNSGMLLRRQARHRLVAIRTQAARDHPDAFGRGVVDAIRMCPSPPQQGQGAAVTLSR
jgi:hypothetical protein